MEGRSLLRAHAQVGSAPQIRAWRQPWHYKRRGREVEGWSNVKLNIWDICAILALLDEGVLQYKIAAAFEITDTTVSKIKHKYERGPVAASHNPFMKGELHASSLHLLGRHGGSPRASDCAGRPASGDLAESRPSCTSDRAGRTASGYLAVTGLPSASYCAGRSATRHLGTD